MCAARETWRLRAPTPHSYLAPAVLAVKREAGIAVSNTKIARPVPSDLQLLIDRMAIQEVLTRYCHAADAGDQGLMRGCFTQDVQAHYDGRPPVSGPDALMDQIQLFRDLESGACTISTHFMGNLRFHDLDAASAETETHVLAFLLVPKASANAVNMRSLRYLDRWRRDAGAWRIAVRKHTLDWSCQVTATFARKFAQRLRRFPEAPAEARPRAASPGRRGAGSCKRTLPR